jgi:predicted transporter
MVNKVTGGILFLAVVVGVAIGLATGFVEQTVIGISENSYYGFPFVWRISNINTGEDYAYFDLLIDCFFWFVIALIGIFSMRLSMNWASKKNTQANK